MVGEGGSTMGKGGGGEGFHYGTGVLFVESSFFYYATCSGFAGEVICPGSLSSYLPLVSMRVRRDSSTNIQYPSYSSLMATVGDKGWNGVNNISPPFKRPKRHNISQNLI